MCPGPGRHTARHEPSRDVRRRVDRLVDAQPLEGPVRVDVELGRPPARLDSARVAGADALGGGACWPSRATSRQNAERHHVIPVGVGDQHLRSTGIVDGRHDLVDLPGRDAGIDQQPLPVTAQLERRRLEQRTRPPDERPRSPVSTASCPEA